MTSNKRLEANRQNALQSTGPKSAEGIETGRVKLAVECGPAPQWDKTFRLLVLLYRAHEQRNFFPRNYLRFLLFLSPSDHAKIETTT